jgi:SAM-dependent methyltransferase
MSAGETPRSSAAQLDDPATTADRAELLLRHGYLRALYTSWYESLLSELPDVGGDVLELGSGGGFLREFLPSVVTSDVMEVPGVDRVIDARTLPFADGALRAIVATNVLHHVPDIRAFLREAARTLAPGGRVVAIEPWPTPFSRIIYSTLHHEPFDMARDWSLPPGGPLTAANGALPWIVFSRDRAAFERENPSLRVRRVAPRMPISYLACGGIGRAWPLPARMFRVLRALESPFDGLGLFALISIERTL